jgi:hypothetical protein
MNTAEQERAAIVAYLRKCQETMKDLAEHYGTTKGKYNFHEQSCRYAADAIEEGEHLNTILFIEISPPA